MLKEKRIEAGMTQVQLAEASGVKLRTIRDWEQRGTAKATAGMLKKAADALGCKVDDLI